MERPLVSVIIPVYNVEKYLSQCLDSVLAQTYSNIEVICVNDGSTDSSLAILRQYEKKDNRIIIIDTDNHGLSMARNIGTSKASGSYLIYLDSDDWIDKETIGIAVENGLQSDVDLVFWNYIREYSDKSAPVDIFVEKTLFKYEAFKCLHQQLIGLTGSLLKYPAKCDSLSTAWGKLYKTSLIQNNELTFVDTSVIGTEDLLFNAEYFNYCKSAIALPHHFNHYRKQNSDSLARRYKPLLYQQWTELQHRLKQVCGEKDYLNQSFYNRIALSLIGLGINVMDSPYSVIYKYNELDNIISSPRYSQALARIELEYMPIHWKLFFWCARHKHTICLLFLFWIINVIITRY